MKLFLTAFFIFFSLLSTFLEEGRHCFALKESSEISKAVSTSDSFCQCSSEIQDNCNDSNCFGSAHFGHGFYYMPLNDSVIATSVGDKLNLVFSSFDHHSLVYLENLLRPPLS